MILQNTVSIEVTNSLRTTKVSHKEAHFKKGVTIVKSRPAYTPETEMANCKEGKFLWHTSEM